MRQYIDVTGKTEDEAISAALAQLSMDRDDVSVEILERAKAGFLGLGSCPARVRVYYGPEEEEAAPVQEEQKPERAEKPAESKPERKPEKKSVVRHPLSMVAGIPRSSSAVTRCFPSAGSHARQTAQRKCSTWRRILPIFCPC